MKYGNEFLQVSDQESIVGKLSCQVLQRQDSAAKELCQDAGVKIFDTRNVWSVDAPTNDLQCKKLNAFNCIYGKILEPTTLLRFTVFRGYSGKLNVHVRNWMDNRKKTYSHLKLHHNHFKRKMSNFTICCKNIFLFLTVNYWHPFSPPNTVNVTPTAILLTVKVCFFRFSCLFIGYCICYCICYKNTQFRRRFVSKFQRRKSVEKRKNISTVPAGYQPTFN